MWTRRTVRPVLVTTALGWDLRDEAPRRAWTAVLGPTPVATYLRLREAAIREQTIRRPGQIETLLREGLVAIHSGTLLVPDRVPPLSMERLRVTTAGRLVLGDGPLQTR